MKTKGTTVPFLYCIFYDSESVFLWALFEGVEEGRVKEIITELNMSKIQPLGLDFDILT